MQFDTSEQRERFGAWLKQEMDRMAQHARRGEWLTGDFEGRLAWCIPGEMLIARFWEKDKPDAGLWLIGGRRMPLEHLRFEHAASAREAARQFVMKWQLQAAQLAEGQAGAGGDFAETAERLTQCAEFLYGLTTREEVWRETAETSDGRSVQGTLRN